MRGRVWKGEIRKMVMRDKGKEGKEERERERGEGKEGKARV